MMRRAMIYLGLAASLALVACGPAKGQPQPARSGGRPCPGGGVIAQTLGGPILIRAVDRPVRLASACDGESLAAHVRAAAPERRFILVVEDLRAGSQPGVVFDVRLSPNGQSLGTLSFFAARPPGQAGTPKRVSYDVTRDVRAMAAAGRLGGGMTVSLAPSGQPVAGNDASIGAVRLIEQ